MESLRHYIVGAALIAGCGTTQPPQPVNIDVQSVGDSETAQGTNTDSEKAEILKALDGKADEFSLTCCIANHEASSAECYAVKDASRSCHYDVMEALQKKYAPEIESCNIASIPDLANTDEARWTKNKMLCDLYLEGEHQREITAEMAQCRDKALKVVQCLTGIIVREKIHCGKEDFHKRFPKEVPEFNGL